MSVLPRSRRHEALAGEHPWSDSGQVVLAGLFFAVLVVDCFVLHWSRGMGIDPPYTFRVVAGLPLLVAGVAFGSKAHGVLLGHGQEPAGLVTSGAFAVVRHPLYLGEVLVLLALGLFAGSLAAVAVWAGFTGFIVFVAGYEERLLVGRFGAAYEEYRARVPMFIPGIRTGRG